MPTVRLTWDDRNSGPVQEEGVNVYRDTSPLDPESLPTPLAVLSADTESYDDETTAADTTYYYGVGPFKGSLLALQTGSITTASGAAVNEFKRTVQAGVVSADLTAFPVKIDLSDAPATWWDEVARSDGGDIRAYETVGGTRLPFYIPVIDTGARTGYGIVLRDVATAANTSTFLIAHSDAGMAPPAAGDTYGQHAVWASYAAAYLLNGNLNDETANGRDLTWNSGSPTYASASQYGVGGGIDMTAGAGYGSVVDATMDDDDFTMFGIAERTVETGTNQTFMGMVDTLGSNTDRQLLGQRDSSEEWTYYSASADWTETGVVCALDSPASMGFRGDADGGNDSYYYFNGAQYFAETGGHLSDKTILVGTGRGSSDSDWRGRVYIALYRVGTSGSEAWSEAEHANWFTEGGLISPDVTEAWVGVLS